jgi:Protein RETICULATA-related
MPRLAFVAAPSLPCPRRAGRAAAAAAERPRLAHPPARWRAARLAAADGPPAGAGAVGRWAEAVVRAGEEEEHGEAGVAGGVELELRGDGVGGDGGGGLGGSGSGGSAGGGSGSSSDGSGEQLPDDVARALALGVLSSEALARYHAAATGGNPLMRLLIVIPSFRTRVLADSAFVFKLLVQELIGNGTCVASEFAVRGKEIVNEIEYVASDLIVGTVVEAAFVWLLAPRLSDATASAAAAAASGSGTGSKIGAYVSSLPANAFEASTALRNYSLSMRAASFVYAGAQYAAIGMVAGLVGTAITYGLIESRKALDKGYVPERPMPPLFASSAGWAAFMALSSNTRFQLVEGIERLLPAVIKGGRVADATLKSTVIGLRFLNNYYGGVQFIQFFRFLGLQAVAEESK